LRHGRATVSRKVAELESRLKTQLFRNINSGPLRFRPSRTYVASDPDLTRCARWSEEPVGGLFFLDDNLAEEVWCACFFAMDA
jgi:hypothetical protein